VLFARSTIDDWKNLREIEYKAKKVDVAKIYIEKLDKLIPGIKDQIEYYEVGTPKTIERYTLNLKGTAYGFSQIPSQASIIRFRQKSRLKIYISPQPGQCRGEDLLGRC
jgi:phytoene dehydrogenase-like protein